MTKTEAGSAKARSRRAYQRPIESRATADPVRDRPNVEMSDTAGHFRIYKYTVLRSLVKEPTLSFFYKYAVHLATGSGANKGDGCMPGTPSIYADPMMETLLEALRPHVEQATSLHLYPTYAYFRVYKADDVLPRHTDRPSCEISLTLSLGYRAKRPWPIWIDGASGASSVDLNPGDAMLYRGIECAHWRTAFDGDHAAQVFLHYVDRNGPHAEWRFDKREGLNSFRHLTKTQSRFLFRGLPSWVPTYPEAQTGKVNANRSPAA